MTPFQIFMISLQSDRNYKPNIDNTGFKGDIYARPGFFPLYFYGVNSDCKCDCIIQCLNVICFQSEY